MQYPIIEQVFSPLYGKPSWNVQKGYGSFLTFEFGEPHLVIKEPDSPSRKLSVRLRRWHERRSVYVHGEWHFWIYCCNWRVLSRGKVIGDSTSTRRIKRAAYELDGQALVRVNVTPRNGSSVFEFDLGGQLETMPYDKDSEQWLLYEPAGYVLTFRADGKYSHIPGNVPGNEKDWQRLVKRTR